MIPDLKPAYVAALVCAACSACCIAPARAADNPASTAPGRAASPAAAVTNAPSEGPLQLTVASAILRGLEHNRAFKVERLAPEIVRTGEDQARAVFDPVLTASLARQDRKGEAAAQSAGSLTNTTGTTDSGDVALEQRLPTGTRLALGGSATLTDSPLLTDSFDAARAGLSVTQSLLQGGRLAANLASLRQARLDTLASQYELRGFAESLVAQIEAAYWDCFLAQRQIEIVRESLRLAEQQLADLRERIRVGAIGVIEASAAEAEVASRKEGLINAQSALQRHRLQLLRLVSPAGVTFGRRTLVLLDPLPPLDTDPEDEEASVQLAARLRPDLNQARLQVQRGELEVVKTKNGLLPRLDLFLNLGRTGYADSFGNAVSDIGRDGHDTTFGVQLEYPLGRRDADARHRRAVLSREQVSEALDNLAQLVELDVRSACVEIRRAREQVAATAATTRFRADALQAETEKFRFGKSTALLVAQAQRDLLASRMLEAAAAVGYRKALVELYLNEGSLLTRRGVTVPGSEPAAPPRTGQP